MSDLFKTKPGDPYSAQELLKDAKILNKAAREDISTMWSRFSGQQNSPALTRSKAELLARIVYYSVNAITELCSNVSTRESPCNESEKSTRMRGISIETAAVYLSLIDRTLQHSPLIKLNGDDNDLFWKTLSDNLVANILIGHYQEPGLMVEAYTSDLNKSLATYNSLPFGKETESISTVGSKGAMLRVYYDKIREIIGIGPDPEFAAVLYLQILNNFSNLQLDKLSEQS